MIFNFYYFGAFSVVFFSCEPRINNEYLTKINQMKWLSRACVNGREDVSKHTHGNILFVARSGSEYKQNETIPFWCLLNRLKGCMMVLSINAESVVMPPSAVGWTQTEKETDGRIHNIGREKHSDCSEARVGNGRWEQCVLV